MRVLTSVAAALVFCNVVVAEEASSDKSRRHPAKAHAARKAAKADVRQDVREHRQDVREKVQDKRSEHADTLEQRREAVHRKALDGLKARHGDKHLADADWLAKHPDVAKRVADNRAFLKDHPKVAAGLLKNEQFRARHPQLAEQMKDRMQQIRDRRGAAHDKGSDRVTDRREKQLSDHPGLAKNLHKHPQAEKVMAKHPHAAKKAAKHHRKASRASRKK
ncbi:MAG: hypothetical protein OER86_00305 [Phycisphaerae bacterium]|nr:hypothetical protein [Phycisphaerae bacterium]